VGGIFMMHERARELRKNMTDAERVAWQQLRYRQFDKHKFRRQAPIGPFIVDSVCFPQKLIVELDGGQHAERQQEDQARTQWLESQGFKVLRFWNHDVLKDWDAVAEVIWAHPEHTPPPPPFPTEEEGRRTPPTPTLPHQGGRGQEREAKA
jgi:2-methylaconitate isomerase